MEQQTSELTLILTELHVLCERLNDTNTRLDVTNARMDRLAGELHAAMTQWKRLGTHTAELEDDVQELARAVHSTPVPQPYLAMGSNGTKKGG
jgi:chromosome segregation ATPase